MSTVLRSPTADDCAAMLALNNDFAVETSLLNIASLQQLVASSFYCPCFRADERILHRA
jgi:predicted GNAT superfamily acetyltransferase